MAKEIEELLASENGKILSLSRVSRHFGYKSSAFTKKQPLRKVLLDLERKGKLWVRRSRNGFFTGVSKRKQPSSTKPPNNIENKRGEIDKWKDKIVELLKHNPVESRSELARRAGMNLCYFTASKITKNMGAQALKELIESGVVKTEEKASFNRGGIHPRTYISLANTPSPQDDPNPFEPEQRGSVLEGRLIGAIRDISEFMCEERLENQEKKYQEEIEKLKGEIQYWKTNCEEKTKELKEAKITKAETGFLRTIMGR